MESIDIFNVDGEFIREGYRGEKLSENEYFKFVHIWIVDGNNVLIQKRSSTRPWAPNKWATTTGIVAKKEPEIVAAVRELKEELGYETTVDNLKFIQKFVLGGKYKGIGYIYITNYNGCEIRIDNDEVVDYKFISLEDMKSMINNKQFIKYGNVNDNLYFDELFKLIGKE